MKPKSEAVFPEIERYMAIPGQASCINWSVKIMELHKSRETKMGLNLILKIP
jgi:uncharacterized protein (DUF885 family)